MENQITVRVDQNLKDRLSSLSSKSGKPIAHLIRQCVIDHLEDMEDVYDSIRRLEKGEKSYSLDEIMKEEHVEH